jgi:hypothetical protein
MKLLAFTYLLVTVLIAPTTVSQLTNAFQDNSLLQPVALSSTPTRNIILEGSKSSPGQRNLICTTPCHATTPVRLGPQYAKLPSCILSFTPSFLLRNQALILIFSSSLNKDIILLLRLKTRLRSLYIIVLSLVIIIVTVFYILLSSITFTTI